MAEQIIAVIEHQGLPETPVIVPGETIKPGADSTARNDASIQRRPKETIKPQADSTHKPAPPLPPKYTETLKPAPSPLIENDKEGEPIGLWIDNRFELIELIGKGSMCKVYKAFDHELKRTVAAKVLHDKFRFDQETDITTRFRGEGELVASLSHPDIIQVYHTTQDPRLGIVLILELVEGPSLRDLLREKTLSAKSAAEITLRVARAIEYAHHGRLGPDGRPVAPVIHRDLKPANILIAGPESLLANPNDYRLHIKVTDFGLGKVIEPDSSHGDLTMHGMIIGTPSYMSPEQARGEQDLTIAVDVYGLGATLYELLTGKPPFSGPTISVVLHQVQEEDPISPSYLMPRIPSALGAICLKCLEKKPSDRYATAQELANDLERWLQHKPTQARVPNYFQVWAKWAAKHPTKALVGTLVTLLSIGILVLGVYAMQQTTARQYMQVNQATLENQRLQLRLLHNKSLATLNGILDLLTDDGPMNNLAGLEPLHLKLNQFYQTLVMENGEGTDVLDPRELGKAHLQLIRLISQKGNKSEAVSVIQQGIALFKKVTESSNPTPQDFFSLGQIHLMAAEVYQDLGQFKEALNSLAQVEEIFQGILNREATREMKFSAELGLGRASHRLGLVQTMQPGQEANAATNFTRAIVKFQDLWEKNPAPATRLELEKHLARSYDRRGDHFLEQGKYFLADEDYWVSHRYRTKLVRELTGLNPEEIAEGHPRFILTRPTVENLESLFQLGRSYDNFGILHYRLGTCSTALDYWARALKIQNRVVALSPNVTEYKLDLGQTLARSAEASLTRIKQKGSLDEAGDLRKCEMDLDRGLGDLLEPLLRDDPASLSIRWSCAKARYLRGETASLKKEPAVAQKHLDKALEIFTPLIQNPHRQAGDHYLMAQIYGLKSSLVMGDATAFQIMAAQACNHLSSAIKMGYLEKTEKEIRADYAFFALASLPEFTAALSR